MKSLDYQEVIVALFLYLSGEKKIDSIMHKEQLIKNNCSLCIIILVKI
jgi:hypothetical protein